MHILFKLTSVQEMRYFRVGSVNLKKQMFIIFRFHQISVIFSSWETKILSQLPEIRMLYRHLWGKENI
jgi:hypothetical protein